MSIFPLKPTSSYIKAYFAALAKFQQHGHTTEGNTRHAFEDLLRRGCGPYGWHLVPEFSFKSTKKTTIRADGALIDDLTLQHGIWEAKDTADDLKLEVRKKVEKGYPLVNTLFQSPDRAILYQDSIIRFDKPITDAANLVEVLQLFFDHQIVPGVDWQKVIKEFSLKIPEIAGGIDTLLDGEHTSNAKFREQFASFAALCRSSINPDLSDKSIRTMLVQHLLTERIFRKVFNNQEFLQRNVIAVEIERVIGSITAKHFSRDQFLKSLDHFYIPLERAAEQQEDYTEKQHFLNAVYEKFFQSFDPKQADTMGIVYTPQPIVDFMVRSVEELLRREFNQSLSDEKVHILDPFTGTGNFITRVMREIKRSALPKKYEKELHCNEIMLLPYYIASMNIEHAYMEKVGGYRSFEGICLVDTFELTESNQPTLFNADNTKRVQEQRKAEIRVVIGNPPYNAGQKKENDANKNRKYPVLDKLVRETFGKRSRATLQTKLRDPYVRAIRWGLNRLEGREGIVAFVTNGSFVDDNTFDGLRASLQDEASKIYCLDLGGNIIKNPTLSGTTHNVFGIQVNVAITFIVKRQTDVRGVFYTSLPWNLRRAAKEDWLSSQTSLLEIAWRNVTGRSREGWAEDYKRSDYDQLLSLTNADSDQPALFSKRGLGVSTNRDPVVYNFRLSELLGSAQYFVTEYNKQVGKISLLPKTTKIDEFTKHAQTVVWSERLKQRLKARRAAHFDSSATVSNLYRPFTRKQLYFGQGAVDRPSLLPSFIGEVDANPSLLVPALGGRSEPWCLASNIMPNLNLVSVDAVQVLPFFCKDEQSGDRRENITDWSLNEFRTHYTDESITKWNIFHATYAILHHPEYRTRYAANLKRELPRIPFPPDFHAFAAAGQRLMELHIDYEQQPEYRLDEIEDPKADISFRVTKMKLSKDKTELRYNDFLLLRGIPAGVYDYRLGNRSALEWVVDQYQVSTDKRSGIVNDPNREDDPKYILRLIGQVITVSLETNSVIGSLPTLGLPGNMAVAEG